MKKIFLSITLILIAFSSPITAQDTDKNNTQDIQSEIIEQSATTNISSDTIITTLEVTKTEEIQKPTTVSTPIKPSQGFSIENTVF